MIANLATPPDPLTARQRSIFLDIVLLVALMKIWALSATPWDWDEFLFMSAVRDYDVVAHHPHPPGFPLFIAAAKLARLVIPDDFRALQSVSLVAALFLFPALFFFGRELRFRYSVALSGALLCALLPHVVVFGGTAFSDIPSLTIVILACALLLRGVRDRRAYFAGTIVLAIAIGIRPQNLFVGLAPGTIATWARVRVKWYDPLLAFVAGALIVGAAYGGAARASGGVDAWRSAVDHHRTYIAKNDAIGAPTRPDVGSVAEELLVNGYRAGSLNYLFTFFALIGIAVSLYRREPGFAILCFTFVPMMVVVLLVLDTNSISRFSLAVAPFFAFTAARGVAALSAVFRSMRLEIVITAILALALVVFVAPALELLGQPSPPYAAAQHVLENVPRATPLYVDHRLKPLADYYFGDYEWTLVTTALSGRIGKPGVLVSDSEIAGDGGGVEFERPRYRLWHFVRHAYFATSVVPVAPVSRFGEGWSGVEGSGKDRFRWMGRSGRVELPPIGGKVRMRLDAAIPVDCSPRPPSILVTLNGRQIGNFPASQEVFRREIVAETRGDAPNDLLLEVTEICNPKQAGTGADDRDLGLLLRELSWEPLHE